MFWSGDTITSDAPNRAFNFSGGPGALPESVLAAARDAIDVVPEAGLSVLGISHRSPWFRAVLDEAEENLRRLLGIPSGYHVLFLQGGSSLQFSMIPMSFLRREGPAADYVVSGYWSAKAVPDARREGPVRIAWDGEASGYRRLPHDGELDLAPNAAYLHYVASETVEGMQFHGIPGQAGVPLVCDMASDFLWRPLPVDRFALIYAHAQKNLGPAGVTVVILRDDWLKTAATGLPTMLDYREHIAARSVYNTPPTFAIYVTLLVTRWLRDTVGGLGAMEQINRRKAAVVYEAIDRSGGFYVGHAEIAARSAMNATFRIARPELEAAFLEEAQAAGLHGLQGHRTIGGLRASLYNAVTVEAAEALAAFMGDFERRRG